MFKSLTITPLLFFTFIYIGYAEMRDISPDYFPKFRNIIEIDKSIINIKVPQVLEVDMGEYETKSAGVYDKDGKRFIPSLFIKENKNKEQYEVSDITNSAYKSTINALNDDDYHSAQRFEVREENESSNVTLSFMYKNKIKTGHLVVSFGSNSAGPVNILIKYIDDKGMSHIALNKIKYANGNLYFPEVEADKFIVEMDYSQPLVISEIGFGYNTKNKDNRYLRFLAQPGTDYSIYINSESFVDFYIGERPELSNNIDILKYKGSTSIITNPAFKLSDVDGDGLEDVRDNCVSIANSDQADINNNGRGDACDDYDRDGVINSKDNCINDTNANQADVDHDNIGDVCDAEESRLTEKYTWLPWLGIGFALVIIGGLGYTVFRDLKNKNGEGVK